MGVIKDWFDRLRVNRMHIKRMLRIGEAAAGNAGITSLLTASALWNPADILDGDMVAVDIAVAGAALGDKVLASFSLDLTDLQLTGDVTAVDTVTAVLSNSTGGAINLAEGTLSVLVIKTAAAGHNQ